MENTKIHFRFTVWLLYTSKGETQNNKGENKNMGICSGP